MKSIEKKVTEMAEHFCDKLCRHPFREDITQEELDEICANCEMSRFICSIVNEHYAEEKKGK